jgi:asparagine synthase (glutamine-hydrolysing)
MWTEGPVGLAVAQDQTLPEDRFDVEPRLRDGVVVAASVRLDNREALSTILGVSPTSSAQMADSAFVRLAWQRWGTQCVHHLVGDFAFVIWSSAERTLFCARDPVGMRPLCYAAAGAAVAVASMPIGILALPGFSRELDGERIAERVAWLPTDATRTMFRGVSMLPAGCVLRATEGRLDVERYWEFSRREIRYRRDEDYVEHFREVFDEAVRCRLRAASPVASLLSAGLDSGAITAVGAQILDRSNSPLVAITWRPRPGANLPPARGRLTDEGVYAAQLASRYSNIDHVMVVGAAGSLFPGASALSASMNEPVRNPFLSPLWRVTGERLREKGCRVLLSGQYGNLAISYDGAGLIASLVRQGRLIRAAHEVLAAGSLASLAVPRALFWTLAALLPVPLAKALLQVAGKPFSDTTSLTDVWALKTRIIRDYMDFGLRYAGLMAAGGFEIRCPAADLRVIDYCLSIPEDQFLRRGQRRWLIRRAMRGAVPDVTLDESRRGLQGSDWPLFVGPYRSEYAQLVDALDRSPLARATIDIPAIRRLLAAWPETWTQDHRAAYSIGLMRTLGIGDFILRFGSAAQRHG